MSDSKVHRRKFVTVRVTSEEKSSIENNAKAVEMDVSTFVRERALAKQSEQQSSVAQMD